MSLATTTEEYRDVLKAQRAMSRMLESDGIKPSEGAQVTRALIEAVRLKRDMRGVPDPRPQDMGPKAKRSRASRAPIEPLSVAPADSAPAPTPQPVVLPPPGASSAA